MDPRGAGGTAIVVSDNLELLVLGHGLPLGTIMQSRAGKGALDCSEGVIIPTSFALAKLLVLGSSPVIDLLLSELGLVSKGSG